VGGSKRFPTNPKYWKSQRFCQPEGKSIFVGCEERWMETEVLVLPGLGREYLAFYGAFAGWR